VEDNIDTDAEVDEEEEPVLRPDETITPSNDILVRKKERIKINIFIMIFRKEKKMKIQIAFHHHQIFVLFIFLFNQQKPMVCF